MPNANSKFKIIYSLRIHIALQSLGFQYKTEMRNPRKPNLNCWVYQNTPEFQLALKQLLGEESTNGQ